MTLFDTMLAAAIRDHAHPDGVVVQEHQNYEPYVKLVCRFCVGETYVRRYPVDSGEAEDAADKAAGAAAADVLAADPAATPETVNRAASDAAYAAYAAQQDDDSNSGSGWPL